MPAPFPPANKRLGQHFLIDQNIVRKIVTAAELTPDDTVLEIGPGRGILTDALSRAARRVVAIEIDAELCALLQARQTDWKNVEVICADALIHPFETLPAVWWSRTCRTTFPPRSSSSSSSSAAGSRAWC